MLLAYCAVVYCHHNHSSQHKVQQDRSCIYACYKTAVPTDVALRISRIEQAAAVLPMPLLVEAQSRRTSGVHKFTQQQRRRRHSASGSATLN